MKRIFMASLAVAAALSLTSCDFLAELLELVEDEVDKAAYVDQWKNLVNETEYNAVVNGNTLTYGSHTYTVKQEIDLETTEFKKPTASVTFTNVPSGYTEFEAVYNGLLGQTLAGTAAMIPMAMEIYARDPDTGQRCFTLLCNGTATVTEILRVLKTKFIPSTYSSNDDAYIQRFLPAVSLKGALPSKAYAPSTPYTVELTMSPNGVAASDMAGGDVVYMYILSEENGGWDTYQCSVSILMPANADHFKVFDCAACYVQCKNIQGTWAGLK